MAYEITYHKAGEDAKFLKVGDFLLTRGENRNARLIRFGQALEHGFTSPSIQVNHAVLCLGGDVAAEALADGVVTTPISTYRNTNYAIVRTKLNYHDQAQVLKYAHSVLNSKHKYGWLHIAAISLRMATGMKYFFGRSETEICSGFVAGALTRGGFIWSYPPQFMTPADLAQHFGVQLYRII